MSNLIERAKQYNQQLKEIETEASNTKAHISYGEADLNKLCNELSSLLGLEITEENVEEICEQQMAKIINDLETGERTIKAIQEGTYSQEELERKVEVMTKEDTLQEVVRHRVVSDSAEDDENTEIDLSSTLESLGGLGSIVGGHQTEHANKSDIDKNSVGESSVLKVPNARILDI